MKKLFLASAVSALFAAPATVLAQAKPAPVPTLDKILEASGISVSGYIDAMYTHSDRNQAAFSTPRVFDQENNSFVLRQAPRRDGPWQKQEPDDRRSAFFDRNDGQHPKALESDARVRVRQVSLELRELLGHLIEKRNVMCGADQPGERDQAGLHTHVSQCVHH